MSAYVLDASVLAKWFVPEVHTEEALRYGVGGHELMAPDLILSELGNILWKKVRRREISVAMGRRIIAKVTETPPLVLYPPHALLGPALEIAIEVDRSVYDSLYLALAVIQNCRLVTADRKLLNSLRRGPLEDRLAWVGDAPNLPG